MRPHKDRPSIGDIFRTRQGCDVEILEYQRYNKILVKFLDKEGHEKYVSKKELLNGRIKNPFHPDVMEIKFYGELKGH